VFSAAFFLQIQSSERNENIAARRLDTFSAGMKPHQKEMQPLPVAKRESFRSSNLKPEGKEKKK
jgi:hypothetical protein